MRSQLCFSPVGRGSPDPATVGVCERENKTPTSGLAHVRSHTRAGGRRDLRAGVRRAYPAPSSTVHRSTSRSLRSEARSASRSGWRSSRGARPPRSARGAARGGGARCRGAGDGASSDASTRRRTCLATGRRGSRRRSSSGGNSPVRRDRAIAHALGRASSRAVRVVVRDEDVQRDRHPRVAVAVRPEVAAVRRQDARQLSESRIGPPTTTGSPSRAATCSPRPVARRCIGRVRP